MTHDITFLERLLDAPGPSGFEVRAARVWREEAPPSLPTSMST
jgi:putative aminopeptidase FrvX